MMHYSIAIGLLAFLVIVQAWEIFELEKKLNKIWDVLDALNTWTDHITIHLEDEDGGADD